MQGTIHGKVVIMASFSSGKWADTVKLAISGYFGGAADPPFPSDLGIAASVLW